MNPNLRLRQSDKCINLTMRINEYMSPRITKSFSSPDSSFLLVSTKNTDSSHSQSRKSANHGLAALLRISRNLKRERQSNHVTMIFPPFSTFAGCHLPFLGESKHFRVCRIRGIFFHIRSCLRKISTPKPFSGMPKEEN